MAQLAKNNAVTMAHRAFQETKPQLVEKSQKLLRKDIGRLSNMALRWQMWC